MAFLRRWLTPLLYFLAGALPLAVLVSQEIIRAGDAAAPALRHHTWATPLHLAALLGLLALALRRNPDAALSESAPPNFNSVNSAHPSPASHLLRRALGAAFVCGLALLAIALPAGMLITELWHTPIYAAKADMLPLMESALHSFWALGRSPYHEHLIAGWSLPLTFLPGLWLPFSLPYHLHHDLRVLSLAAGVTLGALLVGLALARLAAGRPGAKWGAAIPLLIAISFFCSPPFFHFHLISHTNVHVLLVFLWAMSLRLGGGISAGLLFGAALISRPYLVCVLPFYGLYLIQTGRRDRAGAVRHALGIMLPGLALALPFALGNPGEFIRGTLLGYETQLGWAVADNPLRAHGFGLSGLLLDLGLARWKWYYTAALQGVLLALAFWRLGSPNALLLAGAAAVFCFLYFAIVPWYYAFLCPLVMLAAVDVSAFSLSDNSDSSDISDSSDSSDPSGRTPSAGGQSGAGRRLLAGGAAAAALFAGAYAVIALWMGLQRPAWTEPDYFAPEQTNVRALAPLVGFDHWGPQQVTLPGPRALAPAAYLGFPMRGADFGPHPAIALHFTVRQARPGAKCRVTLNAVAAGEIALDGTGDRLSVFPVGDARRLFTGLNVLGFSFHEPGGAAMPPEAVREMDFFIRDIVIQRDISNSGKEG